MHLKQIGKNIDFLYNQCLWRQKHASDVRGITFAYEWNVQWISNTQSSIVYNVYHSAICEMWQLLYSVNTQSSTVYYSTICDMWQQLYSVNIWLCEDKTQVWRVDACAISWWETVRSSHMRKVLLVTMVTFVWLFSTVSFQISPQNVCKRGCKATLCMCDLVIRNS